MKKMLAIAIGGAIGSLLRYLLHMAGGDGLLLTLIITLMINVSGSFLIGFGVAFLTGRVSESVKEGLFTGLLGGYTTFSTLSKEVFMIRATSPLFAFIYAIVTVLAGVMLAYYGLNLGEKALKRRHQE